MLNTPWRNSQSKVSSFNEMTTINLQVRKDPLNHYFQ